MKQEEAAEIVSLFCRLNMNARRDMPIRSSEMGLLILVSKNEGQITPVQAAEYFHITKPMVTAMMRSLVAKKLLGKSPSLEDKRSYYLSTTADGKKLVDQAWSEYNKTIQILQNGMGQSAFVALMEGLSTANAIMMKNGR